MSMDTAFGNGRATLRARGDDLYETPEVAVTALLRVADLPSKIWEPACGSGRIVRVLRNAGHFVCATDLVDYASPDQDASSRDFLFERSAPYGCEAIVTNPPFKLAVEFVEHALKLVPRTVMLLRLAFLESDRRSRILDNGQLADVWVFRKRLPMMHRAGWEGRTQNSGMAFAWFSWERAHRNHARLHRISWDRIT